MSRENSAASTARKLAAFKKKFAAYPKWLSVNAGQRRSQDGGTIEHGGLQRNGVHQRFFRNQRRDQRIARRLVKTQCRAGGEDHQRNHPETDGACSSQNAQW